MNKQATSTDERLRDLKRSLDEQLLIEEREHRKRVEALWAWYRRESAGVLGEERL